jgi:uncharacterized membrane protein YfhO
MNSLLSKNAMPDLTQVAVISTDQNLSSLDREYENFYNLVATPSINKLSNNQIGVKFSKRQTAGFMTIAFDFSPNWKCYSENKELSIFRVNGNFIGIPIASSQTSVSCRYTPYGFYPGLVLLLVILTSISFWHARGMLIQKK